MNIPCPSCGGAAAFEPGDGRPAVCGTCGHRFHPGADRRVVPKDGSRPGSVRTTAAPGAGVAPGQRLGRYEIIEEIGRGGMAVVFRARDVAAGSLVAIKLLPPAQDASEEHVRAFLHEAETAGRLSHPGIAAIREIGCHQGRHFFAMEYVDGLQLSSIIAAGKLLPEEAARIVAEAARAAGAAHRSGVFHRDLKPHNLMVRSDGRPVILDFGLSALLGDRPEADGQIVGTPAYMSPEQARGRAQLGPTGDIYSLGAVLYEAVTGQPPYGGVDAAAIVARVRSGPPPPPRTFAPGLSPRLEGIILKAMDRSPAKRYATAEELADDLDRYRAGDSVRADKPGAAVALRSGYWKAARRARRWVLPAVCVLVGLAVLAYIATMIILGRLAPR
ncbi:MAG TPA: protein kinase [Planctomycetota bacterium]|nr:protein kinase [Planctomycetota bacterium]